MQNLELPRVLQFTDDELRNMTVAQMRDAFAIADIAALYFSINSSCPVYLFRKLRTPNLNLRTVGFSSFCLRVSTFLIYSPFSYLC